MVQAYILIQTEVGKASTVAETIGKIPGVIQVLGRLVVAKIQQVDGITRTLTCPVVHL